MLKQSYDNSGENDFEQWIDMARKKSPHFEFWYTVLELECLMLLFVQSLRVGDFKTFVEVLEEFTPWMFSLNHTNYARWLPVFIQTLKKLPKQHPEVYKEFKKGRFTIQKTNRCFSRISDDQAHEQNNKVIKGSGGAIGIFDSPISLAKWMIAGPEIARMLSTFDETLIDNEENTVGYKHHENSKSFEIKFKKHFKSLREEYEKVGNPFLEDSDIFYTLITKTVMEVTSNKSVYDARKIGKEQYSSYQQEVFVFGRRSIYDTIKRNKLSLYKNTNNVVISTTQKKVTSLKQDCQLYSNLYIACQNRDGDLDEFFAHENYAYPPSLSIYGDIRSTDKSDTIKILENLVESCSTKPKFTAEILDGAAVVQAITPKVSPTFGRYCKNEFTTYLVNKYCQSILTRVDIVFDVYLDNSIKAK